MAAVDKQQISYSRRAAATVSGRIFAAIAIRKRESANGNVQFSFERYRDSRSCRFACSSEISPKSA